MTEFLTAIGYVVGSLAWLIAAIALLILAVPLRRAITNHSRDGVKRRASWFLGVVKAIGSAQQSASSLQELQPLPLDEAPGGFQDKSSKPSNHVDGEELI